jgi:hypothetical protein
MEKLIDETKSGSARADYIKVKHNERLHITHAGKSRAFVLVKVDIQAFASR